MAGNRRKTNTKNRRKQMTAQAQEKQKQYTENVTKAAKKSTQLVKGALQQSAGSYRKAVSGTVSNAMGDKKNTRGTGGVAHRMGNQGVSRRGSNDRNIRNDKSLSQEQKKKNIENINKTREAQKKGAERSSRLASKQIGRGSENIKEAKKGLGKGGKYAADLLVGATQLATDIGIGMATGGSALPATFARAYGGSLDSAEKEGATDKQAMMYGLASAGLETATEKLGNIAAPLQKAYGKGITDSFVNKVVGKMSKQGSKDLAYHGGKTLMAAVTEGLEEMIAEGLEPSIANAIYAEAIGKPHSTSAKDILYAGAVGAGLGGIMGGGGQVVEYNKGKKISDTATEIYGEGGVNDLIKEGLDIDEDAGGSLRAETYREMITSGGIAMGQVAEMAQEVEAQRVRDNNRFLDADNAANREIKERSLDSIYEVDESGEVGLTANAQAAFNANLKKNIETIETLQLPELDARQVAEQVAAIQTGIATVEDISQFTLRKPENRAIYEAITGVKLPETNQEAKTFLFETMAGNRIKAAENQTAWRRDTVRGIVMQDIAPDYGSAGQSAIGDTIEYADIDSADNTEMYLTGFDNAYNAGRAGMSYAEYENMFEGANNNVPPEVRQAAHKAGAEDRVKAAESAERVQLKLGQKVKKTRSNKGSGAQRGKLSVNLAPENKGRFGAQEQIFYKAIASALNIEIRIVDNIEGNGMYLDGVVTMNVNGDRDPGYIFFHEITHHLQDYAPQEYQKLKEFLRTAWVGKDPEGYRAALNAKKSQYAQAGVNLNDEAALDEIIADGTYEFLQDENFINELCAKERGVAQALLDAIRKLIEKIRAILVDGDRFTPKQNEALYSNLDILKEMESLWADALAKAVENRDAVGTVSGNRVVKHQFVGYAPDGKKVYMSDYAEGTQKSEKSADIIALIQNVWSKKPIELQLYEEGSEPRTIQAHFDPDYDNSGNRNTDAGKIAEGNRQGKRAARRMILNLGQDYYELLSEASYLDSEFPKEQLSDNIKDTHVGVIKWHYFGNDIYYAEKDSDEMFPMEVEIVVKEKKNGSFVYNYYANVDETKKEPLHPINRFVDGEPQDHPVANAVGSKEDTLTSASAETDDSANSSNSSTDIITDNTGNGKVKMSLPDTDSNGRELSEGQREYFKDSKMRDEAGSLKVMYHGSDKVRHHKFDADYSDDGISLFFTDDNTVAKSYSGTHEKYAARTFKTAEDLRNFFSEIGEEDYEIREEDGKIVLYDPKYNVVEAAGDKAGYIYEEYAKAVGLDGNANYEVYLDIKHPLVVDADGKYWDELVDEQDADYRYEYALLNHKLDEDSFEIEYADVSDGKFRTEVFNREQLEKRFGITNADLLIQGEELIYPYANESGDALLVTTRDYSKYAKDNGYDGVIFKNIRDNGVYASGRDKFIASTVAIVFESNQIKSVDNLNPTEDKDIRYSLQDSEGRELSEGQQEYFAESKVRNDEGKLIPMYHGTPNGDYDAFRQGTYFTPNKDYADVYQAQGASSLGYKKTANKPDTYEAYLNIKKPFDTRNPEERRIFEEEFYRQWGTGTPLMDSGLPDWLDGEDLIEFIEEMGYDYDGLILDEGGVGGYGDEVVSRGFSYVILNPNQAKSVDNENPTEDPRMRFSLKEPVEETKDLIALHNIHEHKLLSAFKLGGFPMPSIAVTKDNVSHDGFGPISVLFDKSTIDPKASRYNRVYGGDAYTPTFPTVYYEASEKVVDRIRGMVNKHYDMLPDYYQRDVRALRDDTNIEDQLNREGEDGFIEKYLRSYGLKQIYLAETSEIVPVVKKEVRKEITDYQKEVYQMYVDSLGEEAIRTSKGAGIKGRDWFDKHGEAMKNAFEGWLVKNEGFTEEEAKGVVDSQKPIHWLEQARSAATYLNNGGVEIEEREDISSTQEAIDKKINEEDFNAWVKALFDGIVERSGIRNKKDMFTPSGNRRSFKALHDPVTIDNVIRAMRGEEQQTGGAFLGIGNIEGASSREYKSIEDIKADSSRLYEADMDERKESENYIRETIEDLGLRYANGKDYFDARNTLVEAVSNNESRRGIANYLKQYDYIYEYDESIVDELIELRDYIRALPTKYFEAKPRRAVTFDEVKAVIIPDETGEELIAALDENGVEYVTYDGTEEDRLVKINDVAEEKKIKFSLPDSDDIYDYINSNETEFVDVPPIRDYEKERARVKDQTVGELKKQVEKLQSQTKLTHGKVLDPKSVTEEINMLIKSLLSYNDGTKKTDHKLIGTVQKNAKSIYTDIKNGNIEDAAITALNVATEVVENLELVNDEMYQEYKELRSYLKQTKILLPEDFLYRKEFRAENFGRMVLVNEGGRTVDDVYGELVKAFPGMFDETIVNQEDQLQEIADVRASLEPYDIVLSEEETNQLIKETAHDILDIAVHGKPWKSWADRKKEIYDKRTKKLKARHKEALRDVKMAVEMAESRKQAKKKRAQQETKARRDSETEKRRHIGRIEKDLKWLSDRLLKPTDDKHLPDGYQKAIAELLVMVDPQTARSKKLEEKYGISKKRANFLKLKAEYEKIAKTEAEGMIYNEDISNWCEELGKALDDADSIADATVEEMRVIRQLISAITHSVREQNKAFDENLKEGIAGLATETIHKAKASRKTGRRGGLPGKLGTLLNESMITPRDFFEGIGGGLNKAFMSIRKGEDKHINNMTEARAFFAELFGEYANKKKPGSAIEKWRDHHTNEKFELEGGTVTMNVAQRMALYCSLKREQAAGHIFGSGIVVAEASAMGKFKEALGAKKEINYGTTRITIEEAHDIVKTLSPEQIEMADKLQEFLNGRCAEWGNEASMKMFGYKKFTEPNYFPIQSADVYLDSNFEGRQQVERIRNFGFTKGTVVNANNPIVIDDIFTVVADHVNKMSMYNAFAAPIADFTRVYNFKSRDTDGRIIESAKDALANTYGKKVGRYITNFIADLQSNTQTRQEGFTRFVNKTLANYKKATIAANVRVALQQPTALIRALTVIDSRYFVLKNHTPELLKKAKGKDSDYKDMLKHCPIARWKSWGFSQVDMARDIDDIMMNKEWSKLDFVTMQVYGVLDLYTWSKIWGAVRAETKAKHPDVEVGSEEFYAICNERASEVFDKTQVVDSVLHRSQVMRNTDTMSKILTSFMAEPTRTYNMVRSEYAQAMDMWANGEKAKASKKVARASSVYLFNALVCAAAAAVADALRGKDLDDDDEPEEWWELTLSNFMSGANPLNLLPVFKEVTSIWKGWDTSNMALEGIEALVKAEKGLFDKMMGNSDKTWAELLRKQAEAIGLVFGVPVKNILREIESWGKMVGIDVFAAEAGEEEKAQDLKLITDGSGFDNFLNAVGINLSDKEKMDRNFDKTVKSLNRATKNMSEKEKQEYLWKEITANYTNEIKAGNYDVLDNMSRLLEATGGDYKKFEESVISRTKTEMKKSIGVDSAMTDMYREQLKVFGMTDAIINQEVVMKSEAAKAFQLEACKDDLDGMTNAIVTLYNAGLTETELDVLYYNRTKAIDAKDYRTGELIAPCNGEITSNFGYRNAPTAGASTYHKGVDIAVAANSDIAAADGGKISSCGYNSGYGNYVKISHGNGRYTLYAHLNGYYVQKGQAVSKGDVIALSGSTGVSTGPHLHFEVIENGVNVDPLPYLQ